MRQWLVWVAALLPPTLVGGAVADEFTVEPDRLVDEQAADATAMAQMIYPDYAEPKVVFDIFLDHPAKLGSALHWLRTLLQPLLDTPYDMAPEMMQIKVVLHGTELVTLAKRNYADYAETVERMRYYASLGVEFRVCALAAHDYGYQLADLQPFVLVVPSAITELAHWQQQGFAVITPTVPERHISTDTIR